MLTPSLHIYPAGVEAKRHSRGHRKSDRRPKGEEHKYQGSKEVSEDPGEPRERAEDPSMVREDPKEASKDPKEALKDSKEANKDPKEALKDSKERKERGIFRTPKSLEARIEDTEEETGDPRGDEKEADPSGNDEARGRDSKMKLNLSFRKSRSRSRGKGEDPSSEVNLTASAPTTSKQGKPIGSSSNPEIKSPRKSGSPLIHSGLLPSPGFRNVQVSPRKGYQKDRAVPFKEGKRPANIILHFHGGGFVSGEISFNLLF
jgi:hypothetical protein